MRRWSRSLGRPCPSWTSGLKQAPETDPRRWVRDCALPVPGRAATLAEAAAGEWLLRWSLPVDEITSCTLRHTAASRWIAAGAPIPERAKRLGHAQQGLLMTYSHALTSADANSNRRIEEALG